MKTRINIQKKIQSYVLHQRINAALPLIRGDILDIGCGFPFIIKQIQKIHTYTGVEKRIDLLDKLEKNFPEHIFINIDIERQYLDLNSTYDTVLMLAVIEHLKEPSLIFEQMPALLKPDGRLIITSPTRLGNAIHSVGANLGIFSSRAADEHYHIYNHDSLSELIHSYQLILIESKKFLFYGNQLFICQKER